MILSEFRAFLLTMLLLLTCNVAQAGVSPETILQLGLPVVFLETTDNEVPTCEVVCDDQGTCRGIPGPKVTGRLYVQIGDSVVYDSHTYVKDKSGMTIRVRGNTSAVRDKKPYKVKLQKKADLLGRGDKRFENKDWVLLKRGYSADDLLGYEMNRLIGMPYQPAYEYVNLFLNGEYRGLYTIVENVKRDKDSRIDVDKNSGFIVELDAYYYDAFYFQTPVAPFGYTYKYPDEEDVDEATNDRIRDHVLRMEGAVLNGSYGGVIDVDSWVRYVLGHDILATSDVYGCNMYFAKYDDSPEHKIFMPTLWDFDSVMKNTGKWGCKHDYYLYEKLFGQTPSLFCDTYRRLWDSLREPVFQCMDTLLDSLLQSDICRAVDASMPYDPEWWSGIGTFTQQLNNIKTWMAERRQWMDEHVSEIPKSDNDTIYPADLQMTFQILSQEDKTAQIGDGRNPAIPTDTYGPLIIPSVVTLDGTAYNVVGVADSAFYACHRISSVEVPASITYFGTGAFRGCSSLKKVIVHDLSAWCAIDFRKYDGNPLYFSKHLYDSKHAEIKNLVVPDDVTTIRKYVFMQCLLDSVTIPGSVVEIESNAFYDCLSLASLKIEPGLKRIRSYAFHGCSALKSVTLPEGMTRVSVASFMGCTSLESVELPGSLTNANGLNGIDAEAFKGCGNLKLVKSSIQKPFAFGTNAFASIAPDCVLQIPVGTLTDYHKAGWTKEVFGGGVLEVGDIEENYYVENAVTRDFLQNVTYPDDDYSYTKITDYDSQTTPYRKDLPNPVCIAAPTSYEGEYLVMETYHDNLLVRSDTFIVGQRVLRIWNLIPQTQYTYSLHLLDSEGAKSQVATGTFRTEGQVRMLNIDGMSNFRDLGGWKLPNDQHVRYNRLFRSGELAMESLDITPAGIHELLSVQGIGVEIDFGDYGSESPIWNLLEFVHGEDYQIAFYVEGLQETQTQYRNCFEKIVNSLRDGKKVLFHCSRGADRAGAFAFLLEGLLGVSESDMAKDYELTNFFYNDQYCYRSNEDKYRSMVEYVKDNYLGNTLNKRIEQMALSFGISQDDIDDFRILMSEDDVKEHEETPTCIQELPIRSNVGKIYNLQGQRVVRMGKGLYIRDGKKVVK